VGDVVHGVFGAKDGGDHVSSMTVSVTWSLDRSEIFVFVIDAADRARDRCIGTFEKHADAARAALAVARQYDLRVFDHTGVFAELPLSGVDVVPL
jgi:hypothetical protein